MGLRPTKLPPLQISITARKKCRDRQPFCAVIQKGRFRLEGEGSKERKCKKVDVGCKKVSEQPRGEAESSASGAGEQSQEHA